MKKQRAIDAIALYEQLSTEVGSMLKQPPGIIVSKIMAMVLQAPTISRQPDPWTNVEDGIPDRYCGACGYMVSVWFLRT